MQPSPSRPERGRFVRDQVAALRRLRSSTEAHASDAGVQWSDLDVELFEFAPGVRSTIAAARQLRGRYARERFDVVHTHFGLSAYPAFAVRATARGVTLHGTDVTHPRTRLFTRAVLPAIELVGAASQALIEQVPGRRARRRVQVLPCGVDTERFKPHARTRAREALGLEQASALLLLPSDPARAEKRYDRASALARAAGAQLLTLGGVPPERVPLYVNAANAVVVPSDREGFGLAALEALACDVPVLATPVGVHADALRGVAGCLCAPFELDTWKAALTPHLALGGESRVAGRASAERFSCELMARRLARAWSSLVAAGG